MQLSKIGKHRNQMFYLVSQASVQSHPLQTEGLSIVLTVFSENKNNFKIY